jgi:hypothetical protein
VNSRNDFLMSFHVHPYQQDKWDFSLIIPKIANPLQASQRLSGRGSTNRGRKDAGRGLRIRIEAALP